jgi:hypothetical protein
VRQGPLVVIVVLLIELVPCVAVVRLGVVVIDFQGEGEVIAQAPLLVIRLDNSQLRSEW